MIRAAMMLAASAVGWMMISMVVRGQRCSACEDGAKFGERGHDQSCVALAGEPKSTVILSGVQSGVEEFRRDTSDPGDLIPPSPCFPRGSSLRCQGVHGG